MEDDSEFTATMSRRTELLDRLAKAEQRNTVLRGKLQQLRSDFAGGKAGVLSTYTPDPDKEVKTPDPDSGDENDDADTKAKKKEKEEQWRASQHDMAERAAAAQALLLLDACVFLGNTDVHLRASLASLLRQQELTVGHLGVLADKDKQAIVRQVHERFTAQDEADMADESRAGLSSRDTNPLTLAAGSSSLPNGVSGGGALVPSPCPVDASKLATEWARVCAPAAAAAAIPPSTAASSSSSSSTPSSGDLKNMNGTRTRAMTVINEQSVNFIVSSLQYNRPLYLEAMGTLQSSGTDADTLENYGFSLSTMPGYEYEFDEEDTEDNIIVSEHTDDSLPQIKCATLNKLIERLTMDSLNVRYTFLLTYRSFTTPKEFLEKLAARYYVPVPPNMGPDELKLFLKQKVAPIQIKVFGVLKKWLEEHYSDDFEEDEKLRDQLKQLIHTMVQASSGPWAAKSAKSLHSILERKMNGAVTTVEFTESCPRPLVDPKLPLRDFKLINCKPLEIARQLTLVDFAIFKRIKAREFLNQNWNKKHKHISAPNVVAMIERFNQVCGWVQLEVLGFKKLENRATMLIKFLKVAKHCRNLNNFHSMFAIFTALNATAIHRLRKTWEFIPEKQQKRFENFQQLFSHDKNMKRFRHVLQRAITPCIPHIGLFLADLTFIEDGNPDTLRGMINFHKRRMLAGRIMWLKQYQQTAYHFTEVPVLQEYFAKHLQKVDEDQMWHLSQAIEPRERKTN